MMSHSGNHAPHPANQDILKKLARGAMLKNPMDPSPWFQDAYVLRTNPYLQDRLFSLLDKATHVQQGALYGCPVLMAPNGVIFAYAVGVTEIRLRLPANVSAMALEFGGASLEEDADTWITLPVRHPDMPSTHWKKRLVNWAFQAKQYALSLSSCA